MHGLLHEDDDGTPSTPPQYGSGSLDPQLVDAVPQLLLRILPDGRIDFLNQWYTELTGYDRHSALARHCWFEGLHADDVARFRAAFNAAQVSSAAFEVSFRLRHVDGQYRWMSLASRPVSDAASGVVQAWYAAVSDIDDQLRAEEQAGALAGTLKQRLAQQAAELGRTEARYASLFAVSRIAFAEQDMGEAAQIIQGLKQSGVTDLAAYMSANRDVMEQCVSAVRTVSVNEACAQLLGFLDVQAAVDRPVDRTAEDIESVLLRQFEMIFYGWDNVEGRVVLIGNDRRVPVFYSVTRLEDERQLSSMIDISSQERIEELRLAAQDELARASRIATVGAFSASIAHELGQPIASMVMDVQTGLRLLRRSVPDIATAIPILERLARSADRIAAIVQHTRDQIAGGALPRRAIDIVNLIRETCDLLARELRNAGVSVRFECNDPVPLILGDAVDLQQVIVNLVTNAINAMAGTEPFKRGLDVTVTAAVETITVRFADNGSGIPAADLGRLFQPFFTTRPDGVGLGLQICRSTIEGFGGQLTAANRPGGGAIFEFTLPTIAEAVIQSIGAESDA